MQQIVLLLNTKKVKLQAKWYYVRNSATWPRFSYLRPITVGIRRRSVSRDERVGRGQAGTRLTHSTMTHNNAQHSPLNREQAADQEAPGVQWGGVHPGSPTIFLNLLEILQVTFFDVG